MSQSTKVGENPNDKMPPGKPLGHDELASDDREPRNEGGGGGADDPVRPQSSTPGDPLQGDPQNPAGSESVDRDKFRRD